jgi:hypothetical protein
MVDNVIVGYRLLFQEMAPPPIMKLNPMVDFLSSRSPPESASQYPSISLDGVARIVISFTTYLANIERFV